MIKRLLILLIGFSLSSVLWSQPCDVPVPGALNCDDAFPPLCDINDLDGYCTTLPDFPNPSGPSPLCFGTGVPNNTIWFSFQAGTAFMNLNIIPSNCTSAGGQMGIQGGIYQGGCTGINPVVCDGVCTTGTLNLQSGSFIPGEIYYFIIDGCNGSVCDITVDVISGGPLVMGNINNITGPKKVCKGGTFNYNVNNVNGATQYYWTLDGNLLGNPDDEDNMISITFDQEGVFHLCVDVANVCNDVGLPPVQKCIDVTVTEIVAIDPPPAKVCPGDDYVYNGDFYGPGEYDINLTSWQGCDSVVTLKVDEYPIPTKDLGVIYKCYPDCITIQDSYGNGGVYCDNAESETVYLQTWKGCDSIITYTLRLIELEVQIEPPYDIGCSINQTPLDGSNTLDNLANYDHLNIKWTALNGGILQGPDDQLMTSTETGGKYCLTVEAVAPGGTPICKDSACVVVHFDPFSPTAAIIGDTLSCIKDTVTLTGVTGDPASTYKWVGPGGAMYTGKKIKVTKPGLYTLTVTAPNLCQAVASFTVISLQGGPNISANGALLNCTNPSQVITGSSTTPNVSFKWFASDSITVISTTTTATVTVPGNYIFLVHNNKTGCDTTKTVIVDGDFVQPQNVTAVGDTLTCAITPVILLGGSSTAGVTYAWKGPNGFTSSMQNPPTPNPGDFCLIVTNPVNGCKDTACTKVAQDTTSPSLAIVNDTIDCFTYTATIVASSNGTNPSFSWTGPSGTNSGTSYTTGINGTVSVTVTDGYNGCTRSGSVQVIGDPNKPVASANVKHELTCDSLQVALYGSSSLNLPSITYSWSFLSTKFAGTKNTFALEPGDYTFLVTNTNNGCADSVIVTVTQNINLPDVSATNDTTDCITGKATLQGFSTTQGAQFSWWTIPHGPTPIATTSSVTVVAGIYNLVVRDPVNGCLNDVTTEAVKDEDTPDVSLVKDNDLNCTLLTSTLTASSAVSGLSYVWSKGTPTGDPKVVTTTTPGTFTVTVTNLINQCKNSATIDVTQDIVKPTISAVTDTIKCNNPTAHIDGTSDVTNNTTVTWTDPTGANAANTLDFTTSTAQTYTLTVVNNINGCSKTITLKVPQNVTIPNISASGAKIDCQNLIVTATGNSTSPNVSFNWTGPGYSAATKNASGITDSGTYIFTVTDIVNGCNTSQSVVVTKDVTAPDVVATGGTLTCTNNSQVTLTATSAVAGATYSWSGPGGFSSPQQNPVGSTAGPYTVTVTNPVNHCTNTASAILGDDTTAPDLSVNNEVIDCVNTNRDLIAVSNTAGVIYSWNGPGVSNVSTSTINVTKPGDYTIEVTAPNGCKTSKVSNVGLNADLPDAVATAIGELNCTNKSVPVNTNGSSTGPQFSYAWTGPGPVSNNQQFDAIVEGVYYLTITDTSNGCAKDTFVTVPKNVNLPTAIITDQADPKCFGGNDGVISVPDITGGTPPYLYSINGKPFSSQSTFNFLTDGTYKISIQDAAGCEIETLLTLTQPKKLVINAGKDSIISWGTPITLYADTTNAANVNTITWTPNLDSTCFNCLNPTVTLFNAQLFTITVKDYNGCVASDKVLILVKKERPVFIPNTFSPNGDGINDIFFINAGDGIEEVSYFQIYDRWGNKIFDKESFQPNDPDYGWNGLHRGKKVNSAVFVYWALIKFKDGESILYKGDVTVQR